MQSAPNDTDVTDRLEKIVGQNERISELLENLNRSSFDLAEELSWVRDHSFAGMVIQAVEETTKAVNRVTDAVEGLKD